MIELKHKDDENMSREQLKWNKYKDRNENIKESLPNLAKENQRNKDRKKREENKKQNDNDKKKLKEIDNGNSN